MSKTAASSSVDPAEPSKQQPCRAPTSSTSASKTLNGPVQLASVAPKGGVFLDRVNIFRLFRYASTLLLCLSLDACARESTDASKPSTTATSREPARAQARGEPVGLLIQGYNYTDDYINSFTVNGAGGGNLFVSGPESGGSGSVCCFSYQPGEPPPIRLKVKWTATYCLYSETSPYGRTSEHRRGVWKEIEALITTPPSGEPRALEVHFYKDGHVEAAITEGYSPPRFKLARDENYGRPNVTHNYPKCTDEQNRVIP